MADRCKRIFVVGCGRSGTTLLQALLNAHEDIISFPESEFFSSVVDQYESRVLSSPIPAGKKLLYALQGLLLLSGVAPRPRSGVLAINRFIDKSKVDSDRASMGPDMLLLSNQISMMVKVLDDASGNSGGASWLLKTPSNLSYIDVIQKYVTGAKFIHIVRPGKDVVASIYDAALKHPDTVWNKYFYRGSLRRIANMWVRSVKLSDKYQDQSDHIVINYENLVEDPSKELANLFGFLGLDEDPGCIDRYAEQTSNIVSGNEKWKKGVSGEIKSLNKYDEIFDDEQKLLIESILGDIDIRQVFDAGTGAASR